PDRIAETPGEHFGDPGLDVRCHAQDLSRERVRILREIRHPGIARGDVEEPIVAEPEPTPVVSGTGRNAVDDDGIAEGRLAVHDVPGDAVPRTLDALVGLVRIQGLR